MSAMSAAADNKSGSHPGLTLVSPRRPTLVLVHLPISKETGSVRITNLLKTKLAGLLVVALCASLVVPALAGAQQVDPTTSQYGGQLSQINTGGKPGGGQPANTTNSGAPAASPAGTGLSGHVGPLPFTGFDVIAMAAVALAVTGLGLGLQRAVSRETTDDLA
jgi:hypothetical protein